MKVRDGFSQNGEIGPVLVLEISSQKGFEWPALTSVHFDEVYKTKPIHSDFMYGGEMQPFHDFLKKPVFDLNPVNVELIEAPPVVGSQVAFVEGPTLLEESAPYTVDASTVGYVSPIVEESAVDTHHDSVEPMIPQHTDM